MKPFQPKVVDLKPFVPAKDFDTSLAFYQELGFTVSSNSDGIAFLTMGGQNFLLQDFYNKALAENLMIHLQLAGDVRTYWQHLTDKGIAKTYGVKLSDPVQQPWGMLEFCLHDPSGVLWRIAENS